MSDPKEDFYAIMTPDYRTVVGDVCDACVAGLNLLAPDPNIDGNVDRNDNVALMVVIGIAANIIGGIISAEAMPAILGVEISAKNARTSGLIIDVIAGNLIGASTAICNNPNNAKTTIADMYSSFKTQIGKGLLNFKGNLNKDEKLRHYLLDMCYKSFLSSGKWSKAMSKDKSELRQELICAVVFPGFHKYMWINNGGHNPNGSVLCANQAAAGYNKGINTLISDVIVPISKIINVKIAKQEFKDEMEIRGMYPPPNPADPWSGPPTTAIETFEAEDKRLVYLKSPIVFVNAINSSHSYRKWKSDRMKNDFWRPALKSLSIYGVSLDTTGF